MLPPMKEVAPGATLEWDVKDAGALEKILVPSQATILRLRVALVAFEISNTRGMQPVDEYLERSCALQSASTVLVN